MSREYVLPSRKGNELKYLRLDSERMLEWADVVGGGYSDEQAQDAVGNILVDTSSIDFTYDDATPQITAEVLPAGVDHDALLNFEANEHVDHSSVTLTAGEGLTGTGDLTASRTFDLDFSDLSTTDTAVDANDLLSIHDGAQKKIAFSDFESSLTVENLATAFTAGSVIFSDGTNLAENNSGLFWDNANEKLGIRTISPDGILDAVDDGGSDIELQVTQYGNPGAGVTGRKAGGTESSPTAIPDNQTIFAFGVRGYNGTAFTTANNGVMRFRADGTWSGSSTGVKFDLQLTPSDSTTRSTVFAATAGSLSVSQDFDVDTDAFFVDVSTDQVGVGTATPGARFEVETGATEGQEAFIIDQNDADEAFVDFQGTSAANANNNISTWTTGNSPQGHILVEINGTKRWLRFYDAPTS